MNQLHYLAKTVIKCEDGIYTGQLDENRIKTGYGKFENVNGNIYEGYWHQDKFHGHGVFSWKGIYIFKTHFIY